MQISLYIFKIDSKALSYLIVILKIMMHFIKIYSSFYEINKEFSKKYITLPLKICIIIY